MIPYFVFDKIHLGPVTLYSWGTMVGLAFLVGFWLFLYRAKKAGKDENIALKITLLGYLGAALGARILYILENLPSYFQKPLDIFNVTQGGLSFYGGLLFGLLLCILYLRYKKENFWQWADLAAPSLALGLFLGRIGCFLINDHMGTITSLPWAIRWPDGALRHPIAEYLSLWGLLIFILLLFYGKIRKSPREGKLFLVFLVFQSFGRFLLDFLRAGEPAYLGLLLSQWIALLIFLYTVELILWANRKNNKEITSILDNNPGFPISRE